MVGFGGSFDEVDIVFFVCGWCVDVSIYDEVVVGIFGGEFYVVWVLVGGDDFDFVGWYWFYFVVVYLEMFVVEGVFVFCLEFFYDMYIFG